MTAETFGSARERWFETGNGGNASFDETYDSVMQKGDIMDSKELQFFKELLLSQRSEILNKTASLRNDTLSEGSVQGDEADLAVSEQTLEQQLRFQQRDSQHLQKIDYSLGRIEEGSFGMCEGCEEPLDRKRLIARPVANLCVACKEDQESQERRFA